MSGSMFSESQEAARPADLAEIATLANRLRNGTALQSARPEKVSFSQMDITYADGQERHFYRPEPGSFGNASLLRLESIIRSYRAGYW